MAISIIKTIGDGYNRFFRNRTLLTIGIVGALISAVVTLAFGHMLLMRIQTFKSVQEMLSFVLAQIPSPSFLVQLIVAALVSGLVSLFISGALISAAADGDKATIGGAARKAASRYVSLLGTCIVSAVLVILSAVPAIAMIVASFFLLALPGSAITAVLVIMLIGFALMIIPAYVNLRLSLAEAACVVGGKRAIDSIKGSWSMLKGSLWKILGIMLVIGIVEGVLGGIVSIVNSSFGTFVEVLLTYPATVALVLVYMQLAGSSGMKRNSKKE